MLCDYGCGFQVLYVLSNGKKCCSKSYNSCPENKKKNSKGVKKAHQEGKGFKFTDEHRLKSRKTVLEKFVKEKMCYGEIPNTTSIKNAMYEYYNIEYKCNLCGISKWFEKQIILELDHIDGDRFNNAITNLRLLCPNCHSQTETFRGKNINKGSRKVEDDDLITAIKNPPNIRKALIKVGLAPKGDNYNKVRNMIQKYNIQIGENIV